MTENSITFRSAAKKDLPAIVQMLSDDPLGSKRERLEDPLPESYHLAFDEIDKDPNNDLVLAMPHSDNHSPSSEPPYLPFFRLD